MRSRFGIPQVRYWMMGPAQQHPEVHGIVELDIILHLKFPAQAVEDRKTDILHCQAMPSF